VLESIRYSIVFSALSMEPMSESVKYTIGSVKENIEQK
jgi:hypothetical protein